MYACVWYTHVVYLHVCTHAYKDLKVDAKSLLSSLFIEVVSLGELRDLISYGWTS